MCTWYKIQKQKGIYNGKYIFHSCLLHRHQFFLLEAATVTLDLLFNKFLLSATYILGTLFVFADRGVNTTGKDLLPFTEASIILLGVIKSNKDSYISFQKYSVYGIFLLFLKINVTYHITVVRLAFFSLYLGGHSTMVHEGCLVLFSSCIIFHCMGIVRKNQERL